MRKFNTALLTAEVMRRMAPDEVSNIYNGLDCCVTFEIYETLLDELQSSPQYVQDTYAAAMNKHGPVIDMSLRGLKIDKVRVQETIRSLAEELTQLESRFNRILKEVFDLEDFNWRSPTQLKYLFYDVMQIKPIKSRNVHGQYTPTVDRKALEKICAMFYPQPLALYILAMRGVGKSIGFLKTEQDGDGRMRTGFNIAGTNTGRLSSSSNEFNTGTNLQNVTKKLRFPFIADNRELFVNVDLEQADARNVGARLWQTFYDTKGPDVAGAYLDACESGDLHTTVCKMAWTGLSWGDDPKAWRAVADIKAYRDKSYRDLAKALGHGTNFYGQPRTMAGHTQTETKVIEEFQKNYFAAFPLIPLWHKWVKNELATVGYLVTLYGRRRHFFNRMDEPATLREAIAYEPQSMTAHEIDTGYCQLWREEPRCKLLLQVHDSIMFSVRWRDHEELIPRALELLKVETKLKGGRIFSVPLEAETGWNWGPASPSNVSGLATWHGKEERNPPTISLATKRRSLKEYL